MNPKYSAIITLLLVSAEPAMASILIECPKTLSITTSVKTPKGWEAVPPRGEPKFEGIAVYYSHPKNLASQVPSNLPKKGGFEMVEYEMKPNSSEMWLECNYRGTYSTIAKPFPPGLTKCVAYYKKINYGLGPLERFECE